MGADQPLGRGALHCAAADSSGAGKSLGRIKLTVLWRAVDAASILIEDDDVEVDLAPSAVTHDEVAGAGVWPENRRIASNLESGHRIRDIALFNHNIDIAMTPSLATERSIDCPATIQPDVDTILLHERQEGADVICCHSSGLCSASPTPPAASRARASTPGRCWSRSSALLHSGHAAHRLHRSFDAACTGHGICEH